MARPASPSPSRRSPQAAWWLVAIVLIPLAIAALIGRVDPFRRTSASGQALPEWVMPGELRATTSDGMLVKLRVALDAADATNRSALEIRMHQVSLLLETSIGTHGRDELKTPQGIARLADDMRTRLNAYLEAEGLKPVASVAIQDFWHTEL